MTFNIFKSPDIPPQYFEKSESIFKETKPTITQRQPKKAMPTTGDKLKTDSRGGIYKETDYETCEWTRLGAQVAIENKSPDLCHRDFEEIEAQSLKVNFAITIKPMWAAGVKIADIVKSNRGAALFSKRNLEKYWAIFNRSHSPK